MFPFYGLTYDVASVFAHEFGHVAGLNHTGAGVAVMFYQLDSGTIKTVLTSDDLQGYNNIAWNN
ncbi:matrixin family metalloprotease [Paenibacillus sp. GbtcB18]|uniref:matrixin family metalloprotease n=1 Tax=Paenibacillus sp. GbtcB18 TaxID=2824763 RepID=UPI001C2F49A2